MRALLEESAETGDTLFTGDLEAGKILARRDRWEHTGTYADGIHYVHLCDRLEPHEPETIPGDPMCADTAEWGNSKHSLEEAWRYVLGALFGPIDEEYNEAALHAALEVVS